MLHFGRSGPPNIRDTYSLLVLNITFRTTADNCSLCSIKMAKSSMYSCPETEDKSTPDEAQKAVEKLDGRIVDGRESMVQFAKYGPDAELIHKGRIVEPMSKSRGRSRSHNPLPRDEYRERDYRRQSCSTGKDMIMASTGKGRDIITTEAGALVRVLIIIKTMGETNMGKSSTVQVGLMEA